MKARPRPGGLGPLIGIAEVHDLSFAHEVLPLVQLLSEEPELAPDLRRPRPWLPGTLDTEAVLNALLDQEWTGFVAHVGQVGPWVYVPTVADLQSLSAAYTEVVEAARSADLSGSSADLSGSFAGSLLTRLSGPLCPVACGQAAPLDLEAAFWQLAANLAAQRRSQWSSSRHED